MTSLSPKDIHNAFTCILSNPHMNSSTHNLPNVSSNIFSFDLSRMCDEELIIGNDSVLNVIIHYAQYIPAKSLAILINLAIKSTIFADGWKQNNFFKVFKEVIYPSVMIDDEIFPSTVNSLTISLPISVLPLIRINCNRSWLACAAPRIQYFFICGWERMCVS